MHPSTADYWLLGDQFVPYGKMRPRFNGLGNCGPRNAITHRFSLEQAGDAYALMASGKCGKVVINFPD